MIKVRIILNDGSAWETHPELRRYGLMDLCETIYDYRINDERIIRIEIVDR